MSAQPDSKQEVQHEHVFVYGTLVNGSGYDAVIHGFRKDDTGCYPTLVPDGDGKVVGEVHKVTHRRLKELDHYEGVEQGLYTRVRLPMDIQAYIGDPDRLGSDADYEYDEARLQEVADMALVTIRGDSRPSEVPVEEASR